MSAAPLQTQAVKSQAMSSSTHAGLLLQRKCACGSPTSSLTGECAQCKSKKRLQTKLSIGASHDPLEQEADSVADRVSAAPANHAVRGAPPHIQRFTGQPSAPAGMAPASVDSVLASPGKPLDPALQQGMEQRFGHDFSRVRVHSGAAAAQSARDVNAYAYTVGHDMVFGAGRFAPNTHEGRRLIAHELTHVVQQGAPAFVQRAPARGGPPAGATIGDVDTKSNDPNCEYQKGEAARSGTPKGILNYDIEKAEFFGIEPGDAVVIADFKVDDPALRPATESDLLKYWIPAFDKSSMGTLEIVGFSDCVGWESRNKALREQRARAVARLLPGLPTSSAPFDEYLVANTSERGRALNRSVIIKHKSQPPPPPPPEPEVTIRMEEPNTNNCSQEQRRQLSIAFPAAKLMAEQARTAVSSTDKGPVIKFLLQRYFGDDALSHLPEIHAGFVKILSNWRGWDARFDCEKQTVKSCSLNDPHLVALGYFVGAYVKKKRNLFSPNSAYGAVHVCEGSFNTPGDMQRLSASILHELSHRLDNTNDKKYCYAHEAWCSSLSTKAAIDNADSYAQFAREILNSSM